MKKKSLSYKIFISLSYFLMLLFIYICLTSGFFGNADQLTPTYSSALYSNYSLLGTQGGLGSGGLSSPFAPGTSYFQPSGSISDPNRQFPTRITCPPSCSITSINYPSSSFLGTGSYSIPGQYGSGYNLYGGMMGLYGDGYSTYGAGYGFMSSGIPGLYGDGYSTYGAGYGFMSSGIPGLYGDGYSTYGAGYGLMSVGIPGLYGSGYSMYDGSTIIPRPFPPLPTRLICITDFSITDFSLFDYSRMRNPASSPPAF